MTRIQAPLSRCPLRRTSYKCPHAGWQLRAQASYAESFGGQGGVFCPPIRLRLISLPCFADVLAHRGKLQSLCLSQVQFLFACLFRSKGNDKDT